MTRVFTFLLAALAVGCGPTAASPGQRLEQVYLWDSTDRCIEITATFGRVTIVVPTDQAVCNRPAP